ncbi:craniofacial development protein 2-like [Macrobrachium rosenbergii]|uniref:craniofacial development protein 2-like n=1 Tax=Macrobrachium rosenbergii TaxID=79674 RepID=UPI0034D63ACA
MYIRSMPHNKATQEEKNNFMELLDLHLEEQTEGINLMLGDFNARFGCDRRGTENVIGPFGEETRNNEGENLTDFCVRNNLKIMNGFFKHQDSDRYTRYRWNQTTGQFDQRSVTDYLVTSDKKLVQNVKVLPGVSLDSDHRLVIGKINISSVSAQKTEKKVIKIETLKDPDIEMRFDSKFTEKLQQLEQREWEALKESALKVGEEELGCRYVGGTRKRRTVWWNEDVKEVVKIKNKKHRKWMKQRNQQTREEYVFFRNQTEEIKRRSQVNAWIELGSGTDG